jgi:hypothetical protein
MNATAISPTLLRRACAAALFAGIACASHAQSARGKVQAVPQPAAPTAIAPGTPGSPLPSPSGLPSPLPNPAGLSSQFPAGLPSPLPAPAGLTATPLAAAPPLGRAGVNSAPVENLTAPQTTVMGAAAAGYGGVAAAARVSPAPGGGPYTPVQIAQSFIAADANRDGELTRAEAQRLAIAPYSFEEMDLNHDGILTRFEYDDAFGR